MGKQLVLFCIFALLTTACLGSETCQCSDGSEGLLICENIPSEDPASNYVAHFHLERVPDCSAAQNDRGLGILQLSNRPEDVLMRFTHSLANTDIVGVELRAADNSTLLSIPSSLLQSATSFSITGFWAGQARTVAQVVADNQASVLVKTHACPQGALLGRVIMPRCPDYTAYALLESTAEDDGLMVADYHWNTDTMTATLHTKIFVRLSSYATAVGFHTRDSSTDAITQLIHLQLPPQQPQNMIFENVLDLDLSTADYLYRNQLYLHIITASHPEGVIRGRVASQSCFDCYPGIIVRDPVPVPLVQHECGEHGSEVEGSCVCTAGYSGMGCEMPHCSGHVTLTAQTGSIRSHADVGDSNYPAQLACSWHIRGSGQPIHLTLTHIRLMEGDALLIYDGNSTATARIASITGEQSLTTLNAATGDMYILFNTTADSVSATGFSAQYLIGVQSSGSTLSSTVAILLPLLVTMVAMLGAAWK